MAVEIRVAVASNFLLPVRALAEIYQEDTDNKVIISSGSTGKLYAQIVNGAPYDVFLSANRREPERLEKEGYAVSGSRFTYAEGKLVLWDPKGLHQQDTLEAVLVEKNYKRLSIANPLTAPYGTAALTVLQKLGLDSSKDFKILRGENVSQAYQYVMTGAADIGFVALSQLKAGNKESQGTYWISREGMHQPILQQAVLLTSAKDKQQAREFLDFLKSSKGREMIESFGYGIP